MPVCHAITKLSKKCRNRVAAGKYCYIHKKRRFSTLRKTRKSKRRSFKKRSIKKRSWRSRSRKSKCLEYFDKKVRKNMDEYKSGRWSSRKQALAVSYSQTRKKKGCSKFGINSKT